MKQTILAFSFILFTFYEILLRVVKVQEEADEPVNSLDSGRRVIRSLGRQSARSGDQAHARDLQCQRSGGGEALDREEKGSLGMQSSRSGRVVPAVGRRRAQGATRSGDNALRRWRARSGEKAHTQDPKCRDSGGEALARDAMRVPSRCHHRLSRCLHHC